MNKPMLDATLVGDTLAQLRQEKGLSQEVLSGLADIGRSHLSAIERGERKPAMETFFRICCAMDMRMSDVALLLEQRLEKEQ